MFICVCTACLWCVLVVIFKVLCYIFSVFVSAYVECVVWVSMCIYTVSDHLRMCPNGCLWGLSLHVGLSVSVAHVSMSVYIPDYMCVYPCAYVWGLCEFVVIWWRLCLYYLYVHGVPLCVSVVDIDMQRLHVCQQWVCLFVSLCVSACMCVHGWHKYDW